MSIYYSPSARGFYMADIHGENIPKDAKPITNEKHLELIEGQSTGKTIALDKKGRPVLVDPIGPTEEEKVARANAGIVKQILDIEKSQQPRAMRDALLNNDNTRLLAVEEQIKKLRAQLK